MIGSETSEFFWAYIRDEIQLGEVSETLRVVQHERDVLMTTVLNQNEVIRLLTGMPYVGSVDWYKPRST